MDIKEISMSRGQNQNFMDLVEEPLKEKCERYVQRSGGPTNIFKNLDGRTPIQFAEDAFRPLAKFADKIAVVIDGSTTRGFAYPAQSSLYAQQFGLKPEQCFDMVEACNGMARALETAYMMYLTKPEMKDKYIMIINNEMPPPTRDVKVKDIKEYSQVASYYVGLTFSHVCTITILEKSNNHTWRFSKYTKTNYASNINIPLPQIAKGYVPQCKHFDIDLNDQYGQFCIPNFHDQENKARFIISQYYNDQEFFKNDCDVICHTFSRSVYERFLKFTQMQNVYVYYNEVGNLGSCSLPWILHDLYGQDGIPQGRRISFVGNAAGGSNMVVTWKHKDQISEPEFTPKMEISLMSMNMLKLRVAISQKLVGKIVGYQKPKFLRCSNWDKKPEYFIENVKIKNNKNNDNKNEQKQQQNISDQQTKDSLSASQNSIESINSENAYYNDYQRSIYGQQVKA